jgi:hypothetical protein
MRSTTRRLTLQALEDRRCPTSSIFQAGQTLIVRGDSSDNTIVIQDQGPGFQPGQASTTLTANVPAKNGAIIVESASGFPTSGNFVIQVDQEQMLVTGGQGTATWLVTPGYSGTTPAAHAMGATVSLLGTFTSATVTVTIDAQTQVFSNGIKRVAVFALGGNDAVSYLPDPAGGGTEGLTSLLVDLGAGDNVADFNVSRPTVAIRGVAIPTVGLGLQVFGGVGDDTVSVEVGELDAVDVYVHARLGNGTNTFIGAVAGPLTAQPSAANTLLFDVRGGAGTDSIDLEAGGVNADNCIFLASLRGGAGDDNITADVELVGNQFSKVDLTLDGGAGDDVLSATVDNETPSPGNLFPDRVQLIGGVGDDAMIRKFTQSAHDTVLFTDGGAGTDSLLPFLHVDGGNVGKITGTTKAVEAVTNFEF